MRPILTAYNTAVYKLSKFLVPMIDGFTRNEFSLKNSYDFYSALQNFQHSGNVFLVSFDVCSLYTNVPVNEVIDILCSKIFSNCTNFHGFGQTEFLKLLRLIFDNTLFFFNNCLYKQTDGLAMGNPLAPAMANIFLCNLEKEIFKSCPPNCRPLLYRRYLDDTFAVFSDESQAIQFFNHINAAHSNITFTIEKGHDNKLAFLDVLAEYRNSKFHSSIYRKPTFTGLALNFYSYCPIKFKINAIKTLINKAYHLSSSYDLFSAEINYLTTFFSNNGYPVKLFETLTGRFLNSVKCGNEIRIATVPKDTMYVSLPYLGQISHELEIFLLKLLGRNYPQISFKFSFKNILK